MQSAGTLSALIHGTYAVGQALISAFIRGTHAVGRAVISALIRGTHAVGRAVISALVRGTHAVGRNCKILFPMRRCMNHISPHRVKPHSVSTSAFTHPNPQIPEFKNH